MNSRNKRTERTTIRIRPDILEVADNLNREYGYSKGDIFEMGVLLLDSNTNNELILKEKIYSDLIERFEKMEENVKKQFSQTTQIITEELSKLKLEKTKNTTLKEEHNISFSEKQLNDVLDFIIDMVSKREENQKYKGWNKVTTLEPLGSTFYELKAKESGVPLNILLEELDKRGYDKERLIDVGMNPYINWRGEVKSDNTIWG